MADLKQTEAGTSGKASVGARMSGDMAGLLANPLAGAAMMSAFGLGLASHAFGFWAGMMSGFAKVSQPEKARAVSEPTVERPAVANARTAAKVLIEETQSAALEIAGGAAGASATGVAAELLPEDFRQPKAIAKPRKLDDLKAISGIGPKLEKVLNGLGVWTYTQIAAWSPEEIAWVDDYLAFNGRIGRDGWIAQAAALAGRRNGARSAS